MSIFLLFSFLCTIPLLTVCSFSPSPLGLPAQLTGEEAADSPGNLRARTERLHRAGVCATPPHVCK